MKGPLLRWFLIWVSAMAVGIALFGFFGPTAKQIDLNEINYSTTESSVLYFKNMRAFFYDIEEEEKSGFNIYRLGSRKAANSKFHFMIVQNWRMNEAYIMAESDLLDIEVSPIQLISSTNKADTITLSAADAEANYVFAAQLFSALESDAELFLLQNNAHELINEVQRKSIKASLKDYFKLVGKLR